MVKVVLRFVTLMFAVSNGHINIVWASITPVASTNAKDICCLQSKIVYYWAFDPSEEDNGQIVRQLMHHNRCLHVLATRMQQCQPCRVFLKAAWAQVHCFVTFSASITCLLFVTKITSSSCSQVSKALRVPDGFGFQSRWSGQQLCILFPTFDFLLLSIVHTIGQFHGLPAGPAHQHVISYPDCMTWFKRPRLR